MDFIHPDDIEKTKKVDQRLRNNEAVYFSENRYLCKDGSYRWLSWNSFPLKEKNLIFCVARDITRIKETMEALRSITTRYETLLDEVPNIIAEVDLNKRFVWLNRSGLEFYGDDVIGKEAAEFFLGPQDTYARVDPLFTGADDLVYVESLQRRKDGEERMLAWWCKTLKDDKGNVTGVLSTAQDVTELKKSESVIKQSEKKYRDLVEQINDVVFSIDTQAKITYISPVIKQISGYAPEEMTGRSFLDFVFSEDLPILKLLFEERISGKIAPHEFRIETKTGEHLWVRTSSRQIVKNNIIIGLQGVLTDISESKLAGEALKESEERFRVAFKTSPDAIYITRFDDELIIYINDGFTAWSGFSREDVFGKTSIDFGLWVDKTERQELLDKISKEGFVDRFETRFRTKDGRTRIVMLSATIMQIRNQKYLFVTARDIDDLKKAEEALLAEKERLSITLRSIGEGVIAIDLASRVVLMNRIAEELTGWIQDEALGKSIKEVFNIVFEDTRNSCSDIVSNAMRSGETMEPHNDFILISGRGLEKTVNFTATPIRDTESQIIGSVLVFRDVSEKREMEEELRKSQKLESIGVLAGGIAHDFNNILSAILANISLAKITMPENRKAATRLEEAEKAVLRAQGLTQQLLTFSKGGAPVKETSDIREILKDTSLFTLSGSKTKADFAISDDLSPLDVDKGQFSQVINNLIINADQAMPKGGVIKIKAVNIKVGPESSLRLEPGNYLRISISDNGEGISPENLSKIFDPYFTTRSNGSGLGLATTYSIVKRHRGEIRVESKVGIGTTFTIYLPVSKSAVVQRSETQAPVTKGNGRILLMDDEAVIRDVSKEVLEFLGYEASLAKDGESMLEIFKKANAEGKPFDVVILDLTIPGGPGGKEVVKELTKIDPAIKVIAASGYSNDPVMANYKAYGFNGILPKPFTIKDVGFVLKKVLEK
jgi:PAS domain S-box-containing protein